MVGKSRQASESLRPRRNLLKHQVLLLDGLMSPLGRIAHRAILRACTPIQQRHLTADSSCTIWIEAAKTYQVYDLLHVRF